jgi:hypothetical protein
MKVSKLFFALVMMGALAVLGCGDSGSGGGGQSADEVCSGCVNDVGRAACVKEYDQCVDIGVNVEECPVGAQALCDL